jgi:hypothetical protein
VTDTKDRSDRLGDDVLIGAKAIAAELNLQPHEVYYLHRRGRLPIGKLGKDLISSRSALRRALADLIGP